MICLCLYGSLKFGIGIELNTAYPDIPYMIFVDDCLIFIGLHEKQLEKF